MKHCQLCGGAVRRVGSRWLHVQGDKAHGVIPE